MNFSTTLPDGLIQRGQQLLKQDVVRKFVPAVIVRGFGALAGICVSLLVTRTVTPEEAGLFFIAFALIQTGSRVVSLGAPEMTVRVVGANHKSNWEAVNYSVSAMLWSVGKVGLLVALAFSLFARFLAGQVFQKPDLAPLFIWIGLSIFVFSIVQVLAAALQAKHLILTSTFTVNFIGPALFVAVVLSLKLSGVSMDAWRLTFAFALAMVAAFLIANCIWFSDKRANLVPTARLDSSLKSSIAAMFVVVSMDTAVQWSGYLASTTFLTESDMALYATAHRMALVNSFLLLGVSLIVAPKFAGAFADKNIAEIDSLSLLSSRVMLLCAAPVILCMLCFPRQIMSVFGKDYEAAAVYLQILAIGQFINLMTGSVSEILSMTGHERDFRNIVLITGPLSITAAIVLTYQFGTIGAVYATALSVATQNLLAVYMVNKRLGFNTMNIFRIPITNQR